MDGLKETRWRQRFSNLRRAYGLVEDGEVWMDMLERRNLLSQAYDEKTFDTAYSLVAGPFRAAIGVLVARLEKEA
jgi:hypothetical protein